MTIILSSEAILLGIVFAALAVRICAEQMARLHVKQIADALERDIRRPAEGRKTP